MLYLLGEHGRTGDDDVLAVALDQEDLLLADHGPPPPGLGLAVLRTVLAVGNAGGRERLAPLLRRAVQRLERLPVAESTIRRRSWSCCSPFGRCCPVTTRPSSGCSPSSGRSVCPR